MYSIQCLGKISFLPQDCRQVANTWSDGLLKTKNAGRERCSREGKAIVHSYARMPLLGKRVRRRTQDSGARCAAAPAHAHHRPGLVLRRRPPPPPPAPAAHQAAAEYIGRLGGQWEASTYLGVLATQCTQWTGARGARGGRQDYHRGAWSGTSCYILLPPNLLSQAGSNMASGGEARVSSRRLPNATVTKVM